MRYSSVTASAAADGPRDHRRPHGIDFTAKACILHGPLDGLSDTPAFAAARR